jgi:hypothetical protein
MFLDLCAGRDCDFSLVSAMNEDWVSEWVRERQHKANSGEGGGEGTPCVNLQNSLLHNNSLTVV